MRTVPAVAVASARIFLEVVLPVVCIVLVSVQLVSTRVATYHHIDALDEQAHIDYVFRVQRDGQGPAYGDVLTAETRHQIRCRGIENPLGFFDAADCSRPYPDYPQEAASYEAGQPPLYYAVTAWVAPHLGADDPVDAMRLVGVGWLVAGSVALFAALRVFGVHPPLALAGALAGGVTAGVQHAASVVSNDIAVWTLGGVVALTAAVVLTAPRVRWFHVPLVVVVGILAAYTKPTCLLLVGVVSLAVAFRAGQRVVDDRALSGQAAALLGLGLLLSLSAVGATVHWGDVVRARQRVPMEAVPPFSDNQSGTFQVETAFPDLLYATGATAPQFVPKQWTGGVTLDRLVQLSSVVLLGVALLPLLAWRRLTTGPIGIALLVALAVTGPFYAVLFFVTTHQPGWGAQPRFALGLLPLAFVVACTWPTWRWQRWLTIGALSAPGLYLTHVIATVAR